MSSNDFVATKIFARVAEKHEKEKELDRLIDAQNGMYDGKTARQIMAAHNSIDNMRREIDNELSKPILEQPMNYDYDGFGKNYISSTRSGVVGDGYRKNFMNAIRSNFTHEARNYLNEGTLASGGFLLPVEFDKEIVSVLETENIMRKICRVITTESVYKISLLASKPQANWLGEGDEITLTNASFGQVSLEAHKLATAIRTSNEILQDAFIDLEDLLAREFGAAFARSEEDAFLNGTGENNQPLGLLPTLAASASGTLQTTASAISADDLLSLQFSVDRPYRASSSAGFVMADSTLATIRKLKDSTQNYLWTQNLTSGDPPQLLGYPVYVSNFMPPDETPRQSTGGDL